MYIGKVDKKKRDQAFSLGLFLEVG